MRAIGPNESSVGFGAINKFFHELTGVHMSLYNATDLLSIIPLGFILGFAVLGLVEAVRKKSVFKVDYSILVLGGFYIVVMALFVFFEVVVVNYRPVLIGGVLEASYPSSTTLLVMCVMPTAIMQLNTRIKSAKLKKAVCSVITVFTAFMVLCRLVSGVHWFTDIIGGTLISTGLVLMYSFVSQLKGK